MTGLLLALAGNAEHRNRRPLTPQVRTDES